MKASRISADSLTTNESFNSDSECLDSDIVKAQIEAEAVITAEDKIVINESEELPEIPKLLNLPKEDLIQKTHDLKSKNQQLDLLLLKAESYSHFILENQQRTKESLIKSNVDSKGKSSSNKRKRSDTSTDEGFQQPKSLVGGKLLDYQIEGLQWLLSLWENGLSGILADEMGLGKTIQIISLIAYLRERQIAGPYLIIGPLATIPNWINEFKKWLPSCPILLYHSSKENREKLQKDLLKQNYHKLFNSQSNNNQTNTSMMMNFPIIITSYEICMIDKKFFEKFLWQYIVIDEGHRIKNRNCKLLRDLKKVRSINRLLLSGTPIQNTLDELWSLLNFCSPNIFDDLHVFQSWFGFKNIGTDTKVDEILESEQNQRIVSKLHEILRPFLLRRLKKDVLIQMPPKKEIVIYCPLTKLQKEYYYHVENNTIRDSLIEVGLENAKNISQINTTMNLRKVCNHPFLFGEPKDPNNSNKYLSEVSPDILVKASGKFKLFDIMLPKLFQKNHKVLIFSQMTKLLDILEDYVCHKEYEYCRLDGDTDMENKQIAIDTFNKNPTTLIFLLSTHAGGLGINLTSADTVILFDSDWNPHQDSQAQDRCHRLGQSKPVVTYRLISLAAVELSILEKQISKKKLERLTITGGSFYTFNKLSKNKSVDNKSKFTLSKLRQLLDDDVKSLSKRGNNNLSEIENIDLDEIDIIMNRELLFSNENNVPIEGKCYDIVTSDTINILQEIN